MRRLALILTSLVPSTVVAQSAVRYEVSVPAPTTRLFHVKAEFPAATRDTLVVSLPAWSPGNYTIQNYARYVRHFAAKNAAGQGLFWDRLDKDTWRIAAHRSDRVTVEFDYLADSIDLSLARVDGDFAELLGTNLFLYEAGQLDRPAEVQFTLPSGWRVTSALPGSGNGPYRAANYHELSDAMTFIGHYSLDSIAVDGKYIRIAVWPAADYTPAVAQAMRDAIGKQAAVENRLMGGPPYDAYTVFFNVIHGPVSFGGGLEHSASQFDIMPANAFADPEGHLGDFMRPLLSHEMFHLWNVKRIRPAEMWPYDYHAEQFTPLLWWSEGVTDYYADLTNLRAGLWTEEQFLDNVQQNIDQVESAPEPWSEEDGSVATWIEEVFVNSSQLYYPKGSLTGLLMDISIRDASDNRHSLDEVTRGLFTRYYHTGKGFRTSDLLGLLKDAGMPNVEDFYQSYINGREPLPYQQVFAKAGITVASTTTSSPFLGVQMGSPQSVIVGVLPGGAAADAGVQAGDTLVSIGDVPVTPSGDWGPQFRDHYRGKAGQPLQIVVRRGKPVTLTGTVRERTVTQYSLSLAKNPDPKAARIWHGMATGTVGN